MSKLIRRDYVRRGFTMIELLTVIGIICILVAILVPVISQMRKIAQNTDTTAQLTKIAQACQDYFHDFSGYPGPLPDTAVHGYNNSMLSDTPTKPSSGFAAAILGTAVNPVGATFTDVTSSQNLLLGLLGGLTLPTGATIPSYDVTLVPKGPAVLNPLAAQQYPPYLNPAKYDVSLDGVGNYVSMANMGKGPNPADTWAAPGTYLLPEFIDHYSEAHPIIYLRARAGATNACDVASAPATASGAANNGSQYYSAEMAPYAPDFFTQADRYNNYVTLWYNPTVTGSNAYGLLFFQNQALDGGTNTVPRAKDAFLLISAGYDGLYGTKDDIIYPSN